MHICMHVFRQPCMGIYVCMWGQIHILHIYMYYICIYKCMYVSQGCGLPDNKVFCLSIGCLSSDNRENYK